MTFEEWWDAPKTVKQITASTKDIAQQAYAAGREAMKAECVKAVDDAGGDNADYHMNAMKELK